LSKDFTLEYNKVSKTKYKYIYGPVPSRRLGKSLGIDIVPFKICSYDCIYCQLGRTQARILERKPFFDPDLVLHEINSFLEEKRETDYLTFSGSGEPTLNSNIGKIIKGIKKITDIPVVVLTNSSLLWDRQVRKDIENADVVIPSLDAVSEEAFKKINRPVEGLNAEKVFAGLEKFSHEFNGKIFLEILLVKGINDTEKEIELFLKALPALRIDTIQLNTVVRPPAEKFAAALSEKELMSFKNRIDTGIPIEIIAHFHPEHPKLFSVETEAEVKALLKRRPCKLEEMSASLGINRSELLKHLVEMERQGIIKSEPAKKTEEKFYMIT